MDDIYKDMGENMDVYDTSNYDPKNPLYSTTNKEVVGKFKDELGGKVITEFVGLHLKMYSYTTDEGKGSKRAKGVKRSVLKKTIHSP